MSAISFSSDSVDRKTVARTASRTQGIANAESELLSWRPVVGHERMYEVSDTGLVRRIGGQPLLAQATYDGYLAVGLYDESRKLANKRRYRVHRIVLEAFVGPAPAGMVAGHINNIRHDNRLENLRWMTQKENISYRTDYRMRGSGHPHAKLTEALVALIRERCAAGEQKASLAREFGVSRLAIRFAVERRTWKHVS